MGILKFHLVFSDFMDQLKDFGKKLIPNFWDFLIQLTALLILILVAIKLVYKPVKNIIKTRKEYVQNNISDAERAKKESLEQLEASVIEVNENKKKAHEIIEEAEKDALKIKDNILNDANKEYEEKLAKAKKDIELEIEKANDQIRDEIVDVAMKASEKLIGKNITNDDNKKLVDDFIDELGEDKK